MSSFDWDIDLDIDRLSELEVLVMDSLEADVGIKTCSSSAGVAALMEREFGDKEVLQLVVNNHDEETKDMCPYFRVVMSSFMAGSETNRHLRAFYKTIGMDTLNANCDKALVIGLCNLSDFNLCVSVPSKFCISSMDMVDRGLAEEIDSACLKPCAKTLYPEELTLYDIAGMCLPYYVPREAQWRILSFLRHPVAEMVETEIQRICDRWDVFMVAMFGQREPRIPAHIAYVYNVPTVLTTIGGATRSFLARRVPRVGGSVCRS